MSQLRVGTVGPSVFRLVETAIAAPLLAAGFLKLLSTADALYWFGEYADYPSSGLGFAWAGLELGLAFAILLRPHSKVLLGTAATLYSFFAFYSTLQLVEGVTHCSCFGRAPVDSKVRLISCLTLASAGCLLCFRLKKPLTFAGVRQDLARLTKCIAFALISGSMLYWLCYHKYRILLTGSAMIVAPSSSCLVTTQSDGSVKILLPLSNFSDSNLKILGTDLSCQNSVLSELPFTVQPRSTESLEIVVHNQNIAKFMQIDFTLFSATGEVGTRAEAVSLTVKSN